MRRSTYLVLIALASTFLPGLARAQAAEQAADVRCVIVGIRISEAAKNPALRTSGTILAMYYIGKLDGLNRNFDLEDAIVKQLTVMTKPEFAAAARRCGRRLQAKGQQLTKIGKDLAKRGREMLQKSGAHTS